MARKGNGAFMAGPGRPANMDHMLTHKDSESGQDVWREPFSQDADCDTVERAFKKGNTDRKQLPPSA